MAAMTRRMFLMGSASIFPYLFVERLYLALRRYEVPVVNLPAAFDGFTILHLSDLHDKEFGTAGVELVNLVRQELFDMVALTGDLVRGDRPLLTPALELVSALRKAGDHPVFAVLGNHDWRLERGVEFGVRLREAGALVLTNAAVPLEKGKDRLWVAGVDDPITRRDRLDLALERTEPRAPRVLLTHSPMLFPQGTLRGLDLLLAGHTHGGQVRVPVLGAAYVPKIGFFPPWDYGLYRSGATTLIVSGGLGESGLPIRFNIRPELALITLRRHPEDRSDRRPPA